MCRLPCSGYIWVRVLPSLETEVLPHLPPQPYAQSLFEGTGLTIASGARTLILAFEPLPRSTETAAAWNKMLREGLPWHYQDMGNS